MGINDSRGRIPYPGKDSTERPLSPRGVDRYDGCIRAFWKSGMNTADIARKLFVHESMVANRLAKLRDMGSF